MFRVQADANVNVQPPEDDDNDVTTDSIEEDRIVDYTDGALKFVEPHSLAIDERFEYPRDGSDPGLVLIFNQQSFDDPGQTYREGSTKDVNDAITCLSRLGFNITKDNVFNDLDSNEIRDQLDRVLAREELRNVNCSILIFLTHGESNNVLHAKSNIITADAIWKKFTECEKLQGKPKLFLFQACKGGNVTFNQYQQKQEYAPVLVPPLTFSANYLAPDMLVVYSTIEGNISFRYPKQGSWFIQELCKNFSTYGRRDDVTSLIIRTTKCVCSNYFGNDNNHVVKQMPLLISTLRKKFYLTRSKDRSLLLDNRRRLQEMHESVENVLKQIEALQQIQGQQKGKKKKSAETNK